MGKFRVGPNFAVFVLFFGIALFDVFRDRSWGWVAVYTVLGLVFLRFSGVARGQNLGSKV